MQNLLSVGTMDTSEMVDSSPMVVEGEFYINIVETNYRRQHDPLRVPVSPGLSVRRLLVQVVDTFSKSFTHFQLLFFMAYTAE